MFFTVLPIGKTTPDDARERAFLLTDNWDDWGKFSTQYHLRVCDKKGKVHHIGDVKIGESGMDKNQRRPAIPDKFDDLDEQFFSVGQDDTYYENLKALGTKIRQRVLEGLRDMAASEDIYTRFIDEYVTTESLLRTVRVVAVQGQYRRLAAGGARLSKYEFKYLAPKVKDSTSEPLVMEFDVVPESHPPTNIHVLIGRNGVGKTHILNNMTQALLAGEKAKQWGKFESEEDAVKGELFANLVSVSFSAFDPFRPQPERKGKVGGIQYAYVGLQYPLETGKAPRPPKSPSKLTSDFAKSVHLCLSESKVGRWRRALETLEVDPNFKEAEVSSLADGVTDEGLDDEERKSIEAEFTKRASDLFAQLSTGHKIVLLTITRLVETVEERTLVLMDEPELHLHPPLLSAFVRALSDLLIDRNGVAIIATHSPVILQEVPASCVLKLRRSGAVIRADRPKSETFGENVGVLTQEVFGLEVTHAGFHKMLVEAIEKKGDYDSVVEYFGGKLGSEAKAIIRALEAEKDSADGA